MMYKKVQITIQFHLDQRQLAAIIVLTGQLYGVASAELAKLLNPRIRRGEKTGDSGSASAYPATYPSPQRVGFKEQRRLCSWTMHIAMASTVAKPSTAVLANAVNAVAPVPAASEPNKRPSSRRTRFSGGVAMALSKGSPTALAPGAGISCRSESRGVSGAALDSLLVPEASALNPGSSGEKPWISKA
mmetsp:Transcript_41061/g.101326  ORF Transcript_41061/g.101326 Transcript_41061/m.101326 type:complete len:188 (+) Transcript_41061:32-595(+)